jgi:hypothetical protein
MNSLDAFDRSKLYSDEGSPIGACTTVPWNLLVTDMIRLLVRWN